MMRGVFLELSFCSCGSGGGGGGGDLEGWVKGSWLWRERRGLVGVVLVMGEGL